jgi:phosphoglycolate phosphatase
MRSIIFDLDGTLADTSGDMIAAGNHCLCRIGVGAVLDPVRDRAAAFGGARALLRLGMARAGRAALTAADEDAEYAAYLAAYGTMLDRHSFVFDGVEAALDRLAAAGLAMGICTNKPAVLAETLLQRLGLRDRFGVLIGADTLPVRKPDPAPLRAAVAGLGGDPRQSLLVGDTVTDRDTARALGVPVILVSFGGAGAGAAALEPDALIGHFDDLDAAVARLV